MAGIDLPNSPTDGQTFTSGNATYTYIASKGYWKAVTNTVGIQLSSLSVGPEGSPSGNGDISYDNTTGVFTYTPPVISTFDGIITLGTITEKTSLPELVLGSVFAEQAKIQASAYSTYDAFGTSVSISSDGLTAIVGAYQEDTGATNAGAAYIFVRSGTTWTQQAKIQASVPEATAKFGNAVSISSDGNTAIVGSYIEDTGATDAGAAYIFVRSGTSWTQQAKIQASDLGAAAQFGHSVSISGDGNTVIVASLYTAAVYIFVRSGTNWTQQAKIVGSGGFFGWSVSISGDGNTAVVGVYLDDTGATDTGAAYIFVRSGTSWSEQAKIQASDLEASDHFGRSVSISSDGNTAIVGAWQEDPAGIFNAGSAYIFTRSGTSWSEQAKIQASDKEASDVFGISVSISSDGNTVIVGAYAEDTGATGAGAAYIFRRAGTTWTETQKIQASDKEADDQFGNSVGISGNGLTAIVGAWLEDTPTITSGAAYIYAAEVSSIVLHDISQSSIFSHSGLTENITANFTNVPTTNDRTTEIELVIEQGATGYLPAAIQIDGAAQTFVWENGVTPTPSVNASDVVKFTLLRSADTWTVLASLTRFTDAAYPAGGIALTDFSVGAEAAASGDGAISYDNTTGVFTYTPPVIPSSTLFTDLTTFAATTEIASVLTGATGVVAHDVTSNSLFVHSSVATNFTVNFTNAPTTNDRTISVALIINQGATGYLPTAVQIDGVAQTILWQGSTTPTAGTSAIDIASFTLIRSGSAWTVIGTVTAFGVA